MQVKVESTPAAARLVAVFVVVDVVLVLAVVVLVLVVVMLVLAVVLLVLVRVVAAVVRVVGPVVARVLEVVVVTRFVVEVAFVVAVVTAATIRQDKSQPSFKCSQGKNKIKNALGLHTRTRRRSDSTTR